MGGQLDVVVVPKAALQGPQEALHWEGGGAGLQHDVHALEGCLAQLQPVIDLEQGEGGGGGVVGAGVSHLGGSWLVLERRWCCPWEGDDSPPLGARRLIWAESYKID